MDTISAILKALFLDTNPIGLLVKTGIVVLLVVSWRRAGEHTKRYRVIETKWLDLVESRLPDLDERHSGTNEDLPENEAEVSQSTFSGPQLVDLGMLAEDIPEDSIIGDRLKAIGKMRAANVKVNLEALQQMSIAKESSRAGLKVPGFAIGFSMLLGLLGTIIGLTLMVQNIHQTLPEVGSQISVSSWQQSLAQIKEVLSSMKTAFSATFLGLLCSISASLLNLRLGTAQAQFFERLERFTVEKLLPATSPSIEDETLLEKVSFQLQQSFDSMQEITSQNSATIENLNDVEKAFVTILGNLQQSTQNTTSADLSTVIVELRKVVGQMAQVSGSVAQLPNVLQTIENRSQARMEDLIHRSERRHRSASQYEALGSLLLSRNGMIAGGILLLVVVALVYFR